MVTMLLSSIPPSYLWLRIHSVQVFSLKPREKKFSLRCLKSRTRMRRTPQRVLPR